MTIAFLLALFATDWTDAYATSRAGEPGDEQIIQTALGEVSRGTARRLCQSEFVFIGTVTASSSFIRTYVDGDSEILSDLTFNVERVAYGSPGTNFQLTIRGGTVGQTTVVPPKEYPRTEVGKRYAIAASTFKVYMGEFATPGTAFLNQTYWIDAQAQLPSNAELASNLDDFCTQNNIQRYHDLVPSAGQ